VAVAARADICSSEVTVTAICAPHAVRDHAIGGGDATATWKDPPKSPSATCANKAVRGILIYCAIAAATRSRSVATHGLIDVRLSDSEKTVAGAKVVLKFE